MLSRWFNSKERFIFSKLEGKYMYWMQQRVEKFLSGNENIQAGTIFHDFLFQAHKARTEIVHSYVAKK